MDDLDNGLTLAGFRAGQKLFARYTLKRILGRGGMGVVWLVHDEKLERDIALKFLPELVAMDKEAVNDLKRETRRALELTHPRIVRIFDFLQDERTAAISMEYVEGQSLAALKADKAGGCFEVGELEPLVKQLCSALEYAHDEAEVAHRDLKPANVMLTPKGEVKITDFGISATLSDTATRVSKAAGTSGTPVYMSPQQMMGERPAATDDLYALGAMIYELLTGKPPFYTGNILMQVQNKVPPRMTERRAELGVPGEIPEAWETTVAACLSKDPSGRPQNAAEVWARLSGQAIAPVRAPAPQSVKSKPEPKEAPAKASPTPVAPVSVSAPVVKTGFSASLLAVVAASVVAVAAGVWWFGFEQPRRYAEALHLANARGSVAVQTTPAGAEVRIGTSIIEKTPLNLHDVKLGHYDMTLSMPGYTPVARQFEVKENETADLGLISLQETRGKLTLTSQPEGLPFEITNRSYVVGAREAYRKTGVTPATLDGLLLGDYRIVVKRPGWPVQESSCSITQASGRPLELRSPQGQVLLESTPKAMAMQVYRKDVRGGPDQLVKEGTAPLNLTLPPGIYSVKSHREGWADQEATVELADGGKKAWTADFPSTKVQVLSEPAGAMVLLNGKEVGTTPLKALDLPANTEQQLVLSLAGYRVWKDVVTFEANKENTVNAGALVPYRGDLKLVIADKRLVETPGLVLSVGEKTYEVPAGQTEYTVKDVPPGKAALKLTHPMLTEAAESVDIQDGKQFDWRPTMGFKPAKLAVRLDRNVDCEVTVGDRVQVYKAGELRFVEIPSVDTIHFSLKAYGFARIDRDFTLRPGQVVEESIALDSLPPGYIKIVKKGKLGNAALNVMCLVIGMPPAFGVWIDGKKVGIMTNVANWTSDPLVEGPHSIGWGSDSGCGSKVIVKPGEVTEIIDEQMQY